MLYAMLTNPPCSRTPTSRCNYTALHRPLHCQLPNKGPICLDASCTDWRNANKITNNLTYAATLRSEAHERLLASSAWGQQAASNLPCALSRRAD